MPEDTKMSLKSFVTDTHSWVGALVGLVTFSLILVTFGQNLFEAPVLAAQAKERTDDLVERMTIVESQIDNFRIAFCTKPDFLSPSGYAALECGEIDRRHSRPPFSDR